MGNQIKGSPHMHLNMSNYALGLCVITFGERQRWIESVNGFLPSVVPLSFPLDNKFVERHLELYSAQEFRWKVQVDR